MAGTSAGRPASLEDRFRASHDRPSTPARGLTGEVHARTIWGYWAQGYEAMPEFFKLCVRTWQRLNPHWDVRILQQSTVHEYLSECELPNRFGELLSHQTASDCVRLALLARYGGVYMDVSIALRTGLDELCWADIAAGRRPAAVFFHPHYGTPALGGEDLTESWFLAAPPGQPFFLRWRDLLRELLHNRVAVEGLLAHPLYRGVDLSGIDRLNREFAGLTFDFREYLAIHAMCHRLIETEAWARAQWRDEFLRIDAAETAFRLQLRAQAGGLHAAQVLVSGDPQADALLDGVPLVKFTTPHSGPLLPLSRAQLLDSGHALGRLLSPARRGATSAPRAPRAAACGRRRAGAAAGLFCGGLRALHGTAASARPRQCLGGGVAEPGRAPRGAAALGAPWPWACRGPPLPHTIGPATCAGRAPHLLWLRP